MDGTFVAGERLHFAEGDVLGDFTDLEGERYYRISNLEALPPFFMSLVSDSDHWLFLSSLGGLTAGRKHPDHALFPYHADDRIHDSGEHTGPKTILRITCQGRTSIWEPFSQRHAGLYAITRNLYKSVYGNKVLFEEINHALHLTFRYSWMTSERFGFVRRAELVNQGREPLAIALVDGLQNVLPHGLGWRFQLEYSTLGDGYKRTELLEEAGMALFRLSSQPVDRAEPSEALRVNLAWSAGFERPRILLSSTQLEAFRRGEDLREETDIRGRRGAYLLNASFPLPTGAAHRWYLAADVGKDARGVTELVRTIQDAENMSAEIEADIQRGTENLLRLVGSSDGFQATADELSTCRHFSNTLFNLMRGGVPALGYTIPTDDFLAFLRASNADVAAAYDAFLASLPPGLTHAEFLERMAACDDPDLERLAHEYLPLTFSRRHGDPSRPWNIFTIHVKHEDGSRVFNYQGNWRDLFQNWEALACSYPGFVESMIFKFLDASTADGHNPYRVLKEGFEWEVVEPHDPWSYIGYWGDHQVIYLLKLLEVMDRYHPGALARLLDRRLFSYAQVPYRLRPYDAMLADPRNTIDFDADLHAQVMARARQLGADGKLLTGSQGIVHATLIEKLLLVALTKLANFLPGAGIWMNTQRPEWNDANNALVGYGVSVVTLCYLRRYLAHLDGLLQYHGAEPLHCSVEVAHYFEDLSRVFKDSDRLGAAQEDGAARKTVLDALGQAASRYREQVYGKGFSGACRDLAPADLRAFLSAALAQVDHAIRLNRREDGLYHAYNLMSPGGGGIQIRRLYLMLEGQVAALSSGVLSASESIAVLDALRASDLYRPDVGSYLLYPDRDLPRFLDKNRIPEAAVEEIALFRTMLKEGDDRLVLRDANGVLRFNASFHNQGDLRKALEQLQGTPYRAQAARDADAILATYETVFDHQSFTGRSGTFFKYEGLGCVYWHMVSKLLLAVDEVTRTAQGMTPALRRCLQKHYEDIRAGLGAHKSPRAYGAFPTDPYSHTPSFAGVQQPGMTGQVKEDILTRFSELGVHVNRGCLTFLPQGRHLQEFLITPGALRFVDVEGRLDTLTLPPDALGFTVCQVPVVLARGGVPSIRLLMAEGSWRHVGGLTLDAEPSAEVFQRSGRIRRIEVSLGLPESEHTG